MLGTARRRPPAHSPAAAAPTRAARRLGRAVARRFSLVDQLRLRPALVAEVQPRGAPPDTMHALRLLLGSAKEVEGDLAALATPCAAARRRRAAPP
eukprot:3123889-Prymnesium_polylepis.1